MADLLLDAYHANEIGKRLKINRITVNRHLKHMYVKHGIVSGCKMVKLAVALYWEKVGQ